MASLLFSTTATLSSTSTNTIPKLSGSLSNSRCSNLGSPFVVLDAAASSFLANTQKKLQPYDIASLQFFRQNTPLVSCFSRVITSAYLGGDSEDTPDAEEENEQDVDDELTEQDTNDLPLDSEYQEDGVEIQIEKPGKNSRIIRSKVAIRASLQTVWDLLTDYERLADFIPSLAVSQLLEKRDSFARLYQIGEQNLAFGMKFNAKGTIDCFEKDLQTLPSGQKRDIEFKMVEGDFQLFEGKWSVEQESSQF